MNLGMLDTQQNHTNQIRNWSKESFPELQKRWRLKLPIIILSSDDRIEFENVCFSYREYFDFSKSSATGLSIVVEDRQVTEENSNKFAYVNCNA